MHMVLYLAEPGNQEARWWLNKVMQVSADNDFEHHLKLRQKADTISITLAGIIEMFSVNESAKVDVTN